MLEQIKAVQKLLKMHAERPMGKPFFSDTRYRTLELDTSRFAPLEGTCQYLASVDGGNAELLGGACASLQFVRAYANVFQGKTRVHAEKHEFFALTQAVEESQFETIILPIRGGLLQAEGTLKINGAEVQDAEERSKAAQVGALTRRFAEWSLTRKILDQFDDIVLIKDGTLQTSVKKEAFYAKLAFSNANSTRRLIGLSKTSTLLTTSGWSVTDAVEALSPKGSSWAYPWIAKSSHPDHPANVGVCKLHRLGRAFRVDAYKDHESLPWETIAKNAQDPGFLGYPYALIDADKNAKVPKTEAASLCGMVQSKMSGAYEKLAKNTDAHDWLSKL